MTCICQNSSVAGRQLPGEDAGEGCSVPAAYQIGRSSISNVLGNSWGLPIRVLRVFWIFLLQWGRRFAPPSWLRLDRRHCMNWRQMKYVQLSVYRSGWAHWQRRVWLQDSPLKLLVAIKIRAQCHPGPQI